MKITRAAEYWGVPESRPAFNPSDETIASALSAPGITAGLLRYAEDQDGWPDELPGTKLKNLVGDFTDEVSDLLPEGG